MPQPKIDAHQHFWKYTPEEYEWIDESMAAIRRDFLPEDLQTEIRQTGIDGVVAVQARQTLEETRWLLDLVSQYDFIRGVVGWVPLTSPDLRSVLDNLSRDRKLKAVRHVLQGEADDRYMLREDFGRGIELLKEFKLTYDILVFERHLPHATKFVRSHPEQMFVLDHIAKPRIGDGILSPWRENICSLAKYPNVYCKLSGMVTEADYQAWKEDDLKPYFDVVLDAFGPERVLFGSDWPVCLVAASYQTWWAVVSNQISELSDSEQSAILGATATRVYHLDA